MSAYDFIIIGAGMAGASAAYELAKSGRVLLVERESQPGYHTTGRSAALFTEAYGNATIRALTWGGRAFYMHPPSGFSDAPILTPRGALFVGRADQQEALDAAAAEGRAAGLRRLGGAETRAIVPALREDFVAGGVFEADAMDIDVHALHQGYLRGLKAAGGRLICNAEVTAVSFGNGIWHMVSKAGDFTAAVVVNAGGAWADELAELAGARRVGLVPKRRTVITFDPPAALQTADWPLTIGIAEDFYFKPDAGRLLASPADETPMPPCDVQPEELDIAIVVDHLQKATTLEIPRIAHSWAGLRSFVADKTPVVGFDPERAGFFWLAGQGGYGIQTASSMGRVAAALATGGEIPKDLAARGVTAAALSPHRFH